MHPTWRCDRHGAVVPLHLPRRVDPSIVESAQAQVRAGDGARPPLWCPWPMPTGWTLTGVGWAGDAHSGAKATVVACSGPVPVADGPADVLLIAEEPGVGLGARFAGIPGLDPGVWLTEDLRDTAAHARVRADGWPTPLWVLEAPADRSAYVGEARGVWLYIVTWPSTAGFVLAEDLVLCDLGESIPSQLNFGAPSPYLHGKG
jgi:hypothetical protein